MSPVEPERSGRSRLTRGGEVAPSFLSKFWARRAGVATIFVAGRQLSVSEEEMSTFDSGSRVWDAGVALAIVLGDDPATAGKRIIELGSGTGIGGLSAAAAGADVVLTDLSDSTQILPLLNQNIALNGLEGRAVAAELLWGREASDELKVRGPFDLICGSDVLYRSYDDLLKTLVDLSTPGKTEVLLTYRIRDGQKKFFAAAAELFDEVETYKVDGFDYESVKVRAVYCTRLRRRAGELV